MTNAIKKFLRLLGIVWGTALTILFFAVLLLKIDLVMEIFTSPAVVAIVCIVLGISAGFIAGAIVCYLNTVKAVEVREKKIEKLQNDLAKANSNYASVCKTLKAIHSQNTQRQNIPDDKLGARIMSQIEHFPIPDDEEPDLQDENAEDSDESESV